MFWLRVLGAVITGISVLAGCAHDKSAPVHETTFAQPEYAFDASFIPTLVASASPLCQSVIENAATYEVQILYTHIERDKNGAPRFSSTAFRADPSVYFNPASLVKLPVACLALQRLHELVIPGLDAQTPLAIGSSQSCQKPVQRDPTAPQGMPSIGHYVKKALIVSDNDAYNRLYEFLGQRYINETLAHMGYPTARIIRRFNHCSADENRYTNPFTFFTKDHQVLYEQPMLVNTDILRNPLGAVHKGKGYRRSDGRIVHEPFDYSTHNYLSLQDIHTMLQTVFFPDYFPEHQQFKLSPEDYSLVRHCLGCLPRESDIPAFRDTARYPDNYKKYLLFGDMRDARQWNQSVRSFNIVGRSDGFLSDCAYIVDHSENIEFFLSAVIYVNANGIIKDNTYEYESIGLPFLAEIGRAFYAYELSRGNKTDD